MLLIPANRLMLFYYFPALCFLIPANRLIKRVDLAIVRGFRVCVFFMVFVLYLSPERSAFVTLLESVLFFSAQIYLEN